MIKKTLKKQIVGADLFCHFYEQCLEFDNLLFLKQFLTLNKLSCFRGSVCMTRIATTAAARLHSQYVVESQE